MTTSAKFVTGSTMRHVLVMTGTSAVGLVSIFVVDVLNLFYISLLKKPVLTAAIGYASTLAWFFIALGIGLSIATTALTSQAIGRGDRPKANQIAGTSLAIVLLGTVVFCSIVMPFVPWLLSLVGASGETAQLASMFLWITLPSVPLLALGMSMGGLLRSVGDARRGMWVTLAPAVALVFLDPLLIFGLGLELKGAAIAVVLARIVIVSMGWYGVKKIHRLFLKPTWLSIKALAPAFFAVGFPAILTQFASPFANAFATSAMAQFGDLAVAGWAVVSRLTPMAFGVIFAMSGSIGAIIGQNFGAKKFDRVRSTVMDSFKVTVAYCVSVCLILAIGAPWIASAFHAHDQSREVIMFFCIFGASGFIFNGILFVANAALNNLGFAFYSTSLSWGRATIGVVPFVWLGGYWYGIKGVLAGHALGGVAFGLIGAWLCFRVIKRLEQSPPVSPTANA
jgi:putative MATE family efflux protein